MSEEFETHDIDAMLRRSMRARAEPAVSFDLAARAIAKAAPAANAIREISRVQRWNRVFTAAAAVLIVAISLWIIHGRLAAGGFQGWSDSTSETSTVMTTDSSTTSDSSTSGMQWMFIGAAMAVGAVVVVVTQRSLGAADEWIACWASPARQ